MTAVLWLPGDVGGDGWITKEDTQTCGGGGNVHYLDSGDGFLGVHIYQNLSNCIYIYTHTHRVYIIVLQLCLNKVGGGVIKR